MNLLKGISCFLIFNQTTTDRCTVQNQLIISCFLIFNQTTTAIFNAFIVNSISCFLIFNQTTTSLILNWIGLTISCFLIFNQTTTEIYCIPAGRMLYLSVVVWLFKIMKNVNELQLSIYHPMFVIEWQNYNFSILPETEIFTFIGVKVSQPVLPSPKLWILT